MRSFQDCSQAGCQRCCVSVNTPFSLCGQFRTVRRRNARGVVFLLTFRLVYEVSSGLFAGGMPEVLCFC